MRRATGDREVPGGWGGQTEGSAFRRGEGGAGELEQADQLQVPEKYLDK